MYFSNVPRLNTKSYYNKVIGENAGGIYVLRFRDIDLKGGYTLERYTHGMDFTESEDFSMGKKERLLKIFTTDSGLLLVTKTWDKSGTKYIATKSGFGLKDNRITKELFSTSQTDKIEDEVKVDYSSDRKYAAIWIGEIGENKTQKYAHIIFNNSLEIVRTKTWTSIYPYREFELEQTAISNMGVSVGIFSLTRDGKKSSDPNHQEHFIAMLDESGGTNFITLSDYRFFLANYDLVVNDLKGNFLIAGFYDFKKPGAAHGLAVYTFSVEDSTLKVELKPFDRKLVSQLIGAKEEKAGEEANHFFVRKVVPRTDGGFLLVGEYFEITQQMETFYLNGVPQVSSKNLYHYDDVLFVSIDSNYETEWHFVLNKRQSSYASFSYLQSFGIYITEKNINMLYNDNSGQNNRVMHVKITNNGIMEQRIIMNSENEYTAIIPVEGKQTGYNRYVTPVIQNRQMSLLQLIDDSKEPN